MAEAVSASGEVPVEGRSESAPWWPVFAVLGVLWLLAVRQLRYEWTINPQYLRMGGAVPRGVRFSPSDGSAALPRRRWVRGGDSLPS